MTALSEYQRLEARGLWRETAQAQRREVVVSMGDATLIITDLNDRPLAHWSLAAVMRLNLGQVPAVYSPDGLDDETLELPEGEDTMVAALERVRRAIDGTRPKPGRLRVGLIGAVCAGLAAMAVFWLPGALEKHALSVVPDVKRVSIGKALFAEMQSVTGPPCTDREGQRALERLARRLPGLYGPPRLSVMRDGVRGAVHLPGGFVLLNRSVVEDTNDPDVVAGYVITEELRARAEDPLGRLLEHAGPMATVRLLTTGSLPDAVLKSYARALLTEPPVRLPADVLLAGFRAHGVRATPYAYALDITGEATLSLIEADPTDPQTAEPVLRDADWLRIQAICGG